MDKRCSIFTAEMVAVAKAIQKNEKRETDLLILTDSLSAIQELKDNRISVTKKTIRWRPEGNTNNLGKG